MFMIYNKDLLPIYLTILKNIVWAIFAMLLFTVS